MAYLIDTTILGRLANASDVQHAVAARAVLELHRRGEVLDVTLQVVVFNIGGNKYRLIAIIRWDKVYVRHVLTHAEYNRDRWKAGCGCWPKP